MLEIIAIVMLGSKIKKIVKAKGLNPARYILIMVVLWIGCEFAGGFIGGLIMGPAVLAVYPFAIAGAALGGYLGYRIAVNAKDPTTAESSPDILDSNLEE